MTHATTDGIEELIARTRAPRVTPEEMTVIAASFEAIGTERALAHAALARIRSEAMRGNMPADLADVDAIAQRFLDAGDASGHARALFFRGWVLQMTGRYAEALEVFAECLALFQQLDDALFMSGTYTQLGTIHNAMGNIPAALMEYDRALPLSREIDDRHGIAGTMSNIGVVYLSVRDLDRAYRAFHEAIPLHEANNDLKFLAATLNNVGVIHFYRNEFAQAIEIFLRVLDLRQQLGEPISIIEARGTLAEAYVAMGDANAAREMMALFDEHRSPDPQFRIDMIITRARLFLIDADVDSARSLFQQALDMATEYALPSRQIEVHRSLRDLAQQQNDLAAYIDHNTKLGEISDRLTGAGTARQLTEIEKGRELEARTQELDQHRSALHATLPKHIAERVIRGETVNDHFDNASVIFLDIVGFTSLSSTMSSQEVIALLDDVFTQCDAICEKHGVTKIKTIGDSYMAVSFDSVVNAALCALEMSRICLSHAVSHSVSHNVSHEVAFRIGVHCGPVTAGVIGTQRLQYDVWGDTVNVASRMESSGEAGRIHVSEAFASELKRNTEYTIQNPFSESENPQSHEVSNSMSHSVSHEVPLVTRHSSLVTTFRGMIDIKGKGPMRTYWLERSDR